MAGAHDRPRKAFRPHSAAALCRNVINEYASTEAGLAALAPFDLIDGVPGRGWLRDGPLGPSLRSWDDAGKLVPAGQEGMVPLSHGAVPGQCRQWVQRPPINGSIPGGPSAD